MSINDLTEIQMEPTVRCNLNCIMCNYKARQRKAGDMTFDFFKKAINQVPNLRKIHLHGMGESLLNKDLLKMIAYAKKKKIFVCFNSNFTLINEARAKDLIETGLDELRISLDASDRKTYKEIRRKDKFDVVVKNVKTFISKKAELKKTTPHLKICVVVLRKNIKQIPKIIDLANELQIKDVIAQNMQDWSEKEFREEKTKKLGTYMQDERMFEGVLKKGRKYGIKFKFPTKKKRFTCTWYKESCWITTEGYVTPCCNIPDPRILNFGNLNDKSFQEIWDSKQYSVFRDALKNDNPPAICKDCIIFRGEFKDYS